jgi:hypothetical protein
LFGNEGSGQFFSFFLNPAAETILPAMCKKKPMKVLAEACSLADGFIL